MKTKTQKSEKPFVFPEKKIGLMYGRTKKWFYYKTAARTFGPRIRGLSTQYSPGEIMRNPYSQAVYGKKHWFYNSVRKNILKSIGFIDRATGNVKNHWFYR